MLAQLAKGLIEATMGDVLGDLWNCCAEHDKAVVPASSSSQSATQETLAEFLCKRGFSTAMASRIATRWRKAKGDKTAFCKALKVAAKSFATNWQAQSGPVKPPSQSHGVQAFESCQHFTRIEQQMLDTAIEQMLAM